MKKNIFFAVAFIVLGVFAISFRHQIKVAIVGENKNTEPSPSPSASPLVSPSESPLPSVSIRPVPSNPAAYNGRPPEELRPVPDEVKLFSESQKNDLYRSLQNFGKAVKENPDYFEGWIHLGLLKKTIGDYEGARNAWEYAGVIRPQNSISFANLGELYWRYLHVFAQAETNFKTSIKNDPANPGVYVSLSGVYFYSMKEKANLADDVLLQGIAANPQSTDLPKALASLYEKTGEYAKAIEWWKKTLAQDPQNKDIAAVIEGLKKKLGQ